ncbi:MAG TPA: glutamate--tRNA ligase [Nitrospirae bacterium]|nr:glutamate--tRNA ligase [Nitrospirota bacterium]HDO23416.1 glutamate--tRNA ligase [Nitrospirota bacterium]HDZ87816.1 glutamate--tRNA ligase [Nitrospirota bacterium]
MPRVRFAPSPTGFLHIGGARTALFNWLYARHNDGVFVFRIEDTDRTRSTDEYIAAILDGMKWLGLDWDEGPYRQTDRMDIYKKYIRKLIDEDKAYYCYCSPGELEQRRKEAAGTGGHMKYDGRCRERKTPVPDVRPVVRFRMPRDGKTVVEDLIRGNVAYDNAMFDDFIIMRSDGTPTYNFVVVVDDVEMGMTHIIRGDDHLNNTPKQIHIYRALGCNVPKFAHLPMILGSDKTRLSKRHGATSVQAYREMGYLPEALLNYLVRLGWSYGDQEVFSRDELVEKFTLDNIGKAAAVFNPEKLLWMNGQYMKDTPSSKLGELVMPFLVRDGILSEGHALDEEWLSRAIDTLKERAKTLVDMAKSLRYYIAEEVEFDEKARAKFLNEKSLPYLEDLRDAVSADDDFSERSLEEIFKAIMEKHDIKLRKIAQPVRVAMTGGTESPGIFEILDIIGKEKVIKRLEKAITMIKVS